MRALDEYQLFLFDFDGLLVNTEEIHFQAYIRMCARRGFELDWSFERYCSIAHYSSEGLREQIYTQFPKLFMQESSWEVLYVEKKNAFIELINEGAVQLMPGAEKFLQLLADKGCNRAVVTHSADELVSHIRKQNPILNTIPHWITREHYKQAKPNSECYLKAIELLAKPSDRVVGFEDTPRGMRALMGTRAKPILICAIDYPEIPSFLEQGAERYRSINDFLVHVK